MRSSLPVVPIVPTQGEGEGGIDEALREFDVATRDREISDHFPKGDHDSVANRTHDAVPKEQTDIQQGGCCGGGVNGGMSVSMSPCQGWGALTQVVHHF